MQRIINEYSGTNLVAPSLSQNQPKACKFFAGFFLDTSGGVSLEAHEMATVLVSLRELHR